MEKTTFFYEFTKKQSPWCNVKPVSKFTDLKIIPDDFITEIVVFEQLKYFVLATNQGHIVIYKWDRKFPEQKQFMHEFKAHTKAITQMKHMNSNSSYLVTGSLDGNIKIWCLN